MGSRSSIRILTIIALSAAFAGLSPLPRNARAAQQAQSSSPAPQASSQVTVQTGGPGALCAPPQA